MTTPPTPFPFAPNFDRRLIDTPGGWLPDGSTYLAGSSEDIWLLEADGSAPIPLANSPAEETAPTASPDGRWFAYVSNESGREEVYLQALRTSGARMQVSRAGGSSPVWAPGGRALYYLEPNGTRSNLIEVTLDLRGTPAVVARPQLLAGLASDRVDNHANFAVMPDDKHFVLVVPDSGQGTVEVTGWQAALHHR